MPSTTIFASPVDHICRSTRLHLSLCEEKSQPEVGGGGSGFASVVLTCIRTRGRRRIWTVFREATVAAAAP